MGKELQLRQGNFASFSITKLLLRYQMDPDEARDILGAACSLTEDKIRIWHVKMPDLRQATVEMPDIVSPDLHWLADEEADLNDYLQDPTHPDFAPGVPFTVGKCLRRGGAHGSAPPREARGTASP